MSPLGGGEDAELIAAIVRRRSGQRVSAAGDGAVEVRLAQLARHHHFAGVGALIGALRTRRDERLEADLTRALIDRTTVFFRDPEAFAAIGGVLLSRLIEARVARRALALWSAGCAGGQEPYSLAMLLAERITTDLAGWRLSILATDLDAAALEKARRGVYSPFEVQHGLAARRLIRHFRKGGGGWQVNAEVRALVRFEEHNLLEELAPAGRFDAVLCRYVLCGLAPGERARTLARIARALAAGGVLVLGAGEPPPGPAAEWLPLADVPGAYRRPAAPPLTA